MVLYDRQPVAYCVPGLRLRIVLSEGALSALGSKEHGAVVAHERGHTHARHDLVMLPFASLMNLLSWMPYARLAPRSASTLLEMAADDFACRFQHRRVVAAALVHLAQAGGWHGASVHFCRGGLDGHHASPSTSTQLAYHWARRIDRRVHRPSSPDRGHLWFTYSSLKQSRPRGH